MQMQSTAQQCTPTIKLVMYHRMLRATGKGNRSDIEFMI